eukprot:scaffold84408_cov33-Tisochrysis_lutea.AAC.9
MAPQAALLLRLTLVSGLRTYQYPFSCAGKWPRTLTALTLLTARRSRFRASAFSCLSGIDSDIRARKQTRSDVARAACSLHKLMIPYRSASEEDAIRQREGGGADREASAESRGLDKRSLS